MPLVPVVLLLVAALLLSRSEPVSVLLHGLVFGVVALVWLRVRSGQTEPADSAQDPGRNSRALGAAAMVVAGAVIAMVVVGTSSGTDRQVLRGLLPAYDVAQVLDAAGRLPRLHTLGPPPRATSSTRSCWSWGHRRARGSASRPSTPTTASAGPRQRHRSGTHRRPLPAAVDDHRQPRRGRAGGGRHGARSRLGAAVVADGRSAAGVRLPRRGSAEEKEELRYDPATQTAVMTARSAPVPTTCSRPCSRTPAPPETCSSRPHSTRTSTTAPPSSIPRCWLVARGRVADGGGAAGGRTAQAARGATATATRAATAERFGAGLPADHAFGRQRRAVRRRDGADGQPAEGPARVVVGAVLRRAAWSRARTWTAWVELRAADGTWQTLDTDRFMNRRPPPREATRRRSGPSGSSPRRRPTTSHPSSGRSRSAHPSSRPSSPTTARPAGRARRRAAGLAVPGRAAAARGCPGSCRP